MNYIPNKLITVDDKDLPWMNENIKKKTMAKKYACKSFNAKEIWCLLQTPDHNKRIVCQEWY